MARVGTVVVTKYRTTGIIYKEIVAGVIKHIIHFPSVISFSTMMTQSTLLIVYRILTQIFFKI